MSLVVLIKIFMLCLALKIITFLRSFFIEDRENNIKIRMPASALLEKK